MQACPSTFRGGCDRTSRYPRCKQPCFAYRRFLRALYLLSLSSLSILHLCLSYCSLLLHHWIGLKVRIRRTTFFLFRSVIRHVLRVLSLVVQVFPRWVSSWLFTRHLPRRFAEHQLSSGDIIVPSTDRFRLRLLFWVGTNYLTEFSPAFRTWVSSQPPSNLELILKPSSTQSSLQRLQFLIRLLLSLVSEH